MDVQALLEKHCIKYFSALSDTKAAVVEPFNRTHKTSSVEVLASIAKGHINGYMFWMNLLRIAIVRNIVQF